MAYYLDSLSNLSARYATIPTISLVGDFEVTVVASQLGNPSNGTFIFAGTGVAGQNGLDLYRNRSGNYELFINNTSAINTTTPVSNSAGLPDTVLIRRVSGAVELIINGVSRGTVSNSNTLRIDRLFHRNGWSFYGRMALYRLSATASGVTTTWNGASAPSAGSTWIATNGTTQMTLVGFPSDNSQWVFYDDGGAITTATAFTMPQLSVSAVALNSVPVFTAESAFTMPQFSVAAQAGIDAGQITAAASFAMPQFSISAAANNSVPAFIGSASFTMPQFTVAAQASSIPSGVGASVSFAMPQFTVYANAESTLPDYIASAAFVMPQFTVHAVSGDAFPSVANRVLFKMPQFTVDCETINDLFERPGTYSQPTSNPSIYQV